MTAATVLSDSQSQVILIQIYRIRLANHGIVLSEYDAFARWIKRHAANWRRMK